MSPDGSMKPLPEEKLLRLIRGNEPRAVAESPAAPAGLGTAAMATALGGLGGRARSMPWPRGAIGCLSLALLVEVVSLLVEVMRPLPIIHVPAVTPPVVSEPSHPAAPSQEIPSLAVSLSPSVFTPSTGASEAPTVKAGSSASARQLASRLSLMGIISGTPGEAVIEDSQTKRTYFVTTGQVVVEGATLEQILDNRVVLDLDGEKIELTL